MPTPVAVVGIDKKFEIIEGEGLQIYLDSIVVESNVEGDTEMVLENPDV